MTEMSKQQAHAFIRKFVHAWVTCDDVAAGNLVSENFRAIWDPTKPAVEGREGYRKVWRDEGSLQVDLDISWRDPIVDGNTVFCEMWTTMIYAGGDMSNPESGAIAAERNVTPLPVTAVGCSTFDFDSDGLCCEIREYRSVSDGMVPPTPEYRYRMTAREELARIGK